MRKMSPFNSGLCILIAILLSSLPCQDCLAQCTLGGHVYNKDGSTIGGATVRVISRQDSIVAQVMTGQSGWIYFLADSFGQFHRQGHRSWL